MRQGPLQEAVDDEVGVPADRRCEMGVLIEAQREMAKGIRDVARLLERTQHQVRQDSLLGPPHDLANKALIMLRRDAQFAAGERDAHGAFAAVPIGIGSSRLRRRGNAAVAHGKLALVQIFHAQGIAKGARQLFEFENLAGVGLFVHAMQGWDAALKEIAGYGAVGRKHKFFNEAVRDVALAARYVDHALLFIEFDNRFGQIEVDRAVFIPARVQKQRQLLHVAEMMRELGVALAHFGVAFKDLVHVGVGHSLGRTDNAGSHPRRFQVSRGVELHKRAHDQTVLARLQRTYVIRKRFGQHGHGAVGKINRSAAQARFLVESRAGTNIVGDVSDVHLKMPDVPPAFDVNSVIEIARGFPINGHNRQVAKIFASRAFGLAHGPGAKLRFLEDLAREGMRQMMLADDDFGVYTEFARTTQNLDHATAWRGAALWIARQLDVDHGAVEFFQPRNAATTVAAVIDAADTHFLRESRRQFVSRWNNYFVLDARVVGQNNVSIHAIAKQTDDGRMGAAQDPQDAAFGALRACARAPADLHQNVVSVHGVLDGLAGDVHIAIELGHGPIRHHETIAVGVKDQASGEFVTILRSTGRR